MSAESEGQASRQREREFITREPLKGKNKKFGETRIRDVRKNSYTLCVEASIVKNPASQLSP